jgi:hypothetical protein
MKRICGRCKVEFEFAKSVARGPEANSICEYQDARGNMVGAVFKTALRCTKCVEEIRKALMLAPVGFEEWLFTDQTTGEVLAIAWAEKGAVTRVWVKEAAKTAMMDREVRQLPDVFRGSSERAAAAWGLTEQDDPGMFCYQ